MEKLEIGFINSNPHHNNNTYRASGILLLLQNKITTLFCAQLSVKKSVDNKKVLFFINTVNGPTVK